MHFARQGSLYVPHMQPQFRRPGGGAVATAVDMMCQFGGSTDGTAITTALLNAATLGGLPGGTWNNVSPSAATSQKFATSAHMAVNGFAVSGAGNPDATTLGYDIAMNSGSPRYLEYSFTAISQFSLGFAFMLGAGFSSFSYYSFDFAMIVAGADYFAFNFSNTPANAANAHSAAGKGPDIGLAPSTPYWVLMRFNQNGTLYLDIYNLSTKALVGSSTITLTNNAATSIRFGHPSNVGATVATSNIFDGIVIKTGNPILLPT